MDVFCDMMAFGRKSVSDARRRVCEEEVKKLYKLASDAEASGRWRDEALKRQAALLRSVNAGRIVERVEPSIGVTVHVEAYLRNVEDNIERGFARLEFE